MAQCFPLIWFPMNAFDVITWWMAWPHGRTLSWVPSVSCSMLIVMTSWQINGWKWKNDIRLISQYGTYGHNNIGYTHQLQANQQIASHGMFVIYSFCPKNIFDLFDWVGHLLVEKQISIPIMLMWRWNMIFHKAPSNISCTKWLPPYILDVPPRQLEANELLLWNVVYTFRAD